MSSLQVTWSIAARSLKLIPRLPSTFIPSLIMPVFLTIAFTGAFSGLVLLPRFPADEIINWFLPMTIVQGAAFAGVTTGMGVARDLENGFYDRLLSSPASRAALMAGPLVASVLRGLLPFGLLLAAAPFVGADLPGGPLGIGTLAVGSLGIALVAGGWALGLALRFKTMQSAPLMQTGIFLVF